MILNSMHMAECAGYQNFFSIFLMDAIHKEKSKSQNNDKFLRRDRPNTDFQASGQGKRDNLIRGIKSVGPLVNF